MVFPSSVTEVHEFMCIFAKQSWAEKTELGVQCKDRGVQCKNRTYKGVNSHSKYIT